MSKRRPTIPKPAWEQPAQERAAKPRPDDDPTDVVLVHGVEPGGRGLNVIRYRNQKLEAGAVRPLQEGKPIHGEVVRLKPRPEAPVVCDVEAVELEHPAPGAERHGPAQVASASYRENWDRIYKRKRELVN